MDLIIIKTDYNNTDSTFQPKEIEIQQLRLRQHNASVISVNTSLFQGIPADTVELHNMISDPSLAKKQLADARVDINTNDQDAGGSSKRLEANNRRLSFWLSIYKSKVKPVSAHMHHNNLRVGCFGFLLSFFPKNLRQRPLRKAQSKSCSSETIYL